jgi:two-component system, NarL family, nitrate/nitrite response regulator NarL
VTSQIEQSENSSETNRDKLRKLTVRELEVFSLLVNGMSNKEIARDLIITHHTVKSHVAHILKVLGLETRTSAAVFWTKALQEDDK